LLKEGKEGGDRGRIERDRKRDRKRDRGWDRGRYRGMDRWGNNLPL
jgi:hypothetical protein